MYRQPAQYVVDGVLRCDAARRYHAEEMVPELEDLEKRGFFSRDELRRIAGKRTDFEYLLKRRAALREDFLRWATASRACVLTVP